jgi:hypothetical protein
MGPVGAQFSLGQSLNFWIGLVTWIIWYHVDLSFFSVVNSADQFYWPQHIKSKSRYWTFWALIPLTFVFSKNDPLIYWHGGLYWPLISENDPQFYCQGGHWPPFAIFWNEHCYNLTYHGNDHEIRPRIKWFHSMIDCEFNLFYMSCSNIIIPCQWQW